MSEAKPEQDIVAILRDENYEVVEGADAVKEMISLMASCLPSLSVNKENNE